MSNLDPSEHGAWMKEQLKHQIENRKHTTCYQNLNQDVLKDIEKKLSLTRYLSLDEQLSNATIGKIHALYQTKFFTPEEVAYYYIKKIFTYEKELNAVTQVFANIRQRVLSLGEYDPKKILYGIPILLKDNIATKDYPNTAGTYALRDVTTKRASTVAKKLEDAGAIIIGKSNLSEWANFMTFDSSNGYSAIGGQTLNPYGKFDVGGSSSGSAVSVAAGLVPVSIGSETAGSLVYPASQNSVVTIKPTVGLVSRDLIIPISETQDTAGPIASCVRDAALVLTSIAGTCKHDSKSSEAQVRDYIAALTKDVKGLKLGILTNDSIKNEYRDNDEQILNAAKIAFESLGVTVTKIQMDEDVFSTNMLDVLLFEFYRDVNAYLANPDVNTNLSLDAIRLFNNEDLENRAVFGQSIIDKSIDEPIETSHYAKLVMDNIHISHQAIKKAKKEVDVILSLSNYATIVYATCGCPALTVPAGYRESGEPVGITLFANHYEEDVLIQFANAFEQITKHRRMPAL